VIIGDLNVIGTVFSSKKYDPPLIVDADRMSSGKIAAQGLKSVAWRRFQVAQRAGVIDHHKLSAGDFGDVSWKTFRHRAVPKDRFGELAFKAPDHRA
jgi:hypothetical protein